jgi:hypothetical protein
MNNNSVFNTCFIAAAVDAGSRATNNIAAVAVYATGVATAVDALIVTGTFTADQLSLLSNVTLSIIRRRVPGSLNSANFGATATAIVNVYNTLVLDLL